MRIPETLRCVVTGYPETVIANPCEDTKLPGLQFARRHAAGQAGLPTAFACPHRFRNLILKPRGPVRKRERPRQRVGYLRRRHVRWSGCGLYVHLSFLPSCVIGESSWVPQAHFARRRGEVRASSVMRPWDTLSRSISTAALLSAGSGSGGRSMAIASFPSREPGGTFLHALMAACRRLLDICQRPVRVRRFRRRLTLFASVHHCPGATHEGPMLLIPVELWGLTIPIPPGPWRDADGPTVPARRGGRMLD